MPEATQDTGSGAENTAAEPSARLEPWYVVYTKPLRERATEYRIRQEGGVAWLPLEPPPKRRSVQRERVIRPLFPRYLFTQTYPWTVVRNQGGEEMASLLVSPMTRKPLAMPSGAIEALMAACPGGVYHPPEAREVERKDLVRVEEGPFSQFTGICTRTTRERIWIILRLMGRDTEVPFTRNQVELVA